MSEAIRQCAFPTLPLGTRHSRIQPQPVEELIYGERNTMPRRIVGGSLDDHPHAKAVAEVPASVI